MSKILIIDDERNIRNTLKEILEYEKYEISEASGGPEGLDLIRKIHFDLVLCDIKMEKMDGMEVLTKALEIHSDLPFIMITGHGTIETAIEASKKGAFDFISKPPDLNRLLITVRNALDRSVLVKETKILKNKVNRTREILGDSPSIVKIKETINRVAPTDARVLITGDNGSGKELVARWVHEKSSRSESPLIEVNCAAIPSELIESELFGHEKGSFTSAIKQRIGKFEQADGGTLFLDEIGDMSLSAQAKVLRALQENKITRVGGEKELEVNVRIIAATNKNLLDEIEKGNFRLDLYHRLSVIIIHVPSLRERSDDIPLLSKYFIREICHEYKIPEKEITKEALLELEGYKWTGNIRELHNMIERLVIMSNKEIVLSDVKIYSNQIPEKPNFSKEVFQMDQFQKFQDFKEHIEMEFIRFKLQKNNWNVSKTAEEIDIQRSHLYSKIEKFGLKREEI